VEEETQSLTRLNAIGFFATEEHYSVLPQRMVGFDYGRKARKAAEELVARIG